MKIAASEIGIGQVLSWDHKLWRVLKKDHVKPGKGGAFVQLEMKTLDGQTKRNQRFRSDESVEKAFIEGRKMQYLYQDGTSHYFMDPHSFEQIAVDEQHIEDILPYLIGEVEYQMDFFEGQMIGVQAPAQVTLSVTESEEHIKGQTAASSGKLAVLETGLRIQVPAFIEVGDKIKVATHSGKYVERA